MPPAADASLPATLSPARERSPADTAPPPPARPDAAPPASGTVSGRVGAVWRKRLTIAGFLLPALLLYLLLALLPIFQGAFYSGFDWNGLEPLDEFVGFQNYRDALADPVFLDALRHVGLILVLSLALQLPFALGLAVLLNQRMRGRALLRLLFFLPFVLSDVISAIVWRLLLQPGGLLDSTMDGAGMEGQVQLWLADP